MTCGMWFQPFIEGALHSMTTLDPSGIQLCMYDLSDSSPYRKVILMNRDLDVALPYYTVGICTGASSDILSKLIENSHKVVLQRKESVEAVMFDAYATLIRESIEESPLYVSTLTMKTVQLHGSRIKTAQISAKYRDIKSDMGQTVVESAKTLYGRFTALGFETREVGGHANVVITDNPKFVELFIRCMKQFGSKDNIDFFREVIVECMNDSWSKME